MYLHRARPFLTIYRPRRFAVHGGHPLAKRDPAGPGVVATILFLCLFAAQSGQLALTPVLADAAREFGVSTAAAGQIRTAAAVVAAAAALAVGAVTARVRLPTVLSGGIALLVVGAAMSFVAPSVFVLIAGQALTGAASSILVAAGVAAAAAWSDDVDRGRVVAWALVGAPTAWVVAMPVIGVVGATSWRLAFVVPIVTAAVAAVALRRAPVVPPPRSEPGLRMVLADRALRGWAISEVSAYAAWSGVLVYCGALFVESYGSSLAVVGVSLGLGAAAVHPGNVRCATDRRSHAAGRCSRPRACYSLCSLSRSASFGWAPSRRRSASAPFASSPGPAHIWVVPSGSSSPQASTPQPCRSAPPPPRSVGSWGRRWRGVPRVRGVSGARVGLCCAFRRRRDRARARRRRGHATRAWTRHSPGTPSTRSGSCSRSPEDEAGAGHEVANGRRDQHLARLGALLQVAGDGHRDPCEQVGAKLLLARMQACPCRPPDRACKIQQRGRAPDRACRTVEHRDEGVGRERELPPPEACDICANSIACLLGAVRLDHEHRRQHPVGLWPRAEVLDELLDLAENV